VDGESSLTKTLDGASYFSRHGVKMHVRAPGQHAHTIERRGGMFRTTLHAMEEQLERDGITNVPLDVLVGEAVFAGNALVSVNDTTPYHAVYGRVPRVLPNCLPPDTPDLDDEATRGMPGYDRHSHRVREVALQKMIQGTAEARVLRAAHAHTRPAAHDHEWVVGEQIDFYREHTKDAPGWNGPATICDLTQVTHGTIRVRWQSRILNVKAGWVRRHQSFWCMLAAPAVCTHGAAMQGVRTFSISIGQLNADDNRIYPESRTLVATVTHQR
jgi:hypothetical protein